MPTNGLGRGQSPLHALVLVLDKREAAPMGVKKQPFVPLDLEVQRRAAALGKRLEGRAAQDGDDGITHLAPYLSHWA